MKSKNVLTFPVTKQPRKTILSKIIAFFHTPDGRIISHGAIGAVGLGILTGTYLPQTVFFEEYREYFLTPTLTDLTPKEVNDELHERCKAAGEKIPMKSTQRKLIKTLTVSGFDIREFGALTSIYGAWVGIPANYFYKSVDDVDKNKMLIQNDSIKWDQGSGQMLQDSLVLTESEQTFAFLRSLLELKSYRIYLNTMLPCGGVIAASALGQFVNIKWKMFERPNYVRFAGYPVVGLISYGLYGIIADFYTFQREKSIDKELAKMGPETIDAGISFYTKMINKNTALRDIGGKENGNEHRWLGFRTTPIAQRKQFFEAKLKELRQQQEEGAASSEAA